VTFRDMANNRTNRHQWIVLDGDIDAEWIEVRARAPAGPPLRHVCDERARSAAARARRA
jgi:hypothetical protein